MEYSRFQAFVHCAPTRSFQKLEREEIKRLVSRCSFGQRLVNRNARRAMLYNHVAEIARTAASMKTGNVVSMLWTLQNECDWLSMPVNLRPRSARACFQCTSDVYNY